MIVLLDNGHGIDTAGKRSPDGRLREYEYAREIVQRVHGELGKLIGTGNIKVLIPEKEDISLKERCRRANAVCKDYGAKNVILISVHCNAAGADGKWHEARGWSAHVSLNASVNSKTLARRLIEAAETNGLKIRKYSHQVPYVEQNLAICRDTICPAVLTENLFQDNKEDVDFLLSEKGKQVITKVHVEGIMSYIKKLSE